MTDEQIDEMNNYCFIGKTCRYCGRVFIDKPFFHTTPPSGMKEIDMAKTNWHVVYVCDNGECENNFLLRMKIDRMVV